MTPKSRRWIMAGAIASVPLITLGLVGCSYGHKRYPLSSGKRGNRNLAIVQFDDYGNAWNAQDVQDALDLVSANSQTTNCIVFVYVHGWQHKARESDSNLIAFHKTLGDLETTLSRGPYVEARKRLSGELDVKVTGIYVGWRGRSLPSFLDYLTFWGRKSAAEQVGSGDFREFCERLQKIYEQRNFQDDDQRFMGLTFVGHSFGGQVLFNATGGKLEQSMVEQTARFSGLTNGSSNEAKAVVSGFGDLVVLLNPALEAAQFERISQLNSKLEYSNRQTPAIFVVSGEGDTARQKAFPIGRRLTRPFRPPFRAEQRELWYTALGEYEPQRTHTLTPTTNSSQLTENSYMIPEQLLNFDFTGRLWLGELHGGLLEPIAEEHQPYSAVVVACTSSKLIMGHTGIFTEPFRDFLTVYVAFLEGKRALLKLTKQMEPSASSH